jgi:hypothetical protein
MILDKFKHIDVLGTSCKYIGELNHVLDVPEGKVDMNLLFKQNPLVNSSVLLKTSVIKEFKWINRFNLEDYDLWFRLIAEKKEYKYLINRLFITEFIMILRLITLECRTFLLF